MKHVVACLAIAACLGPAAAAQLPFLTSPPQEKKSGVQKPAAPSKPIVPSANISTTPKAATPSGAATPFASELQSLSPSARTFATSKLGAMTPALRVRYATRVTGGAIGLSQIPETWLATTGSPVGARLWLGAKSADLLTGPDMEAMFRVAGNDGVERGADEKGVWVQFNAEAGLRYLLVCDLTDPARWDVVPDNRGRAPMTAETETRGIALIAARPAGYARVLLTLARPQQTGPGSGLMEVLRRCEVTPIRA